MDARGQDVSFGDSKPEGKFSIVMTPKVCPILPDELSLEDIGIGGLRTAEQDQPSKPLVSEYPGPPMMRNAFL